MKAGDRPFMVGRCTRSGTTFVLLRRDAPIEQPIQGPWTLRAVVAPAN